MKIYNQSKTEILENVDLSKGYLLNDKILVAHHEAISASPGTCSREFAEALILQGEDIEYINEIPYRILKRYADGGKSLERLYENPPQKAKEAYDEYEDIQVFIPYTEEELQRRKEREYPLLVEKYIREKYTLADELAILRQRETKQEEFNEYYAYAESCKERAKAEVGLC